MQKGSLVVLKNTIDVLKGAVFYTVHQWPFPKPETVYVMAADIRSYKCSSCEKTHTALTLEEIPKIEYNPEWFDEVQSPTAVNIDELVQKTELVHTP